MLSLLIMYKGVYNLNQTIFILQGFKNLVGIIYELDKKRPTRLKKTLQDCSISIQELIT
jgi:hypothetical protein